jgi:cytosolic phospholipase A2
MARIDTHSMPSVQSLRKAQKAYESNENDDMTKRKSQVDRWEAHWQWVEFTPLQVGSDELKGFACHFLYTRKSNFFYLAWIPTWSFGRQFRGGKSHDRVPEQNFTLLVG